MMLLLLYMIHMGAEVVLDAVAVLDDGDVPEAKP